MKDTFNHPVISLPEMVFFPGSKSKVIVNQNKHYDTIDFCINESKELGLSLGGNKKLGNKSVNLSPHKICVVGEISEINELPDGAKSFTFTGLARVELMNTERNLPFPIYNSINIPDVMCSSGFPENSLHRLKEYFEKWLNQNINDSKTHETISNELQDAKSLIDLFCFYALRDVELKQILLENTSLIERIRILSSLFDDQNSFSINSVTANKIKNFSKPRGLFHL